MTPRSASRTGPYSPPLTYLDDAVSAVEVKQNLTDEPIQVKGKPPDLGRVIAHIHALGYHLVVARDLPHGSRP